MGPKLASVIAVIIAIALPAMANDDIPEPSVAFMCNKPAMHRTVLGWVKDESTDCLNSPQEILEYCKKMYPGMDITNIVEATHFETISNWCKRNHKHCHRNGEYTIRPIRCLVGPFQSDALLVPRHCNFSHEHDPKKCLGFDAWTQSAMKRCAERNMHLHKKNYAMLQPCGTDLFAGVEFVCCPKSQIPPQTTMPVQKAISSEGSDENVEKAKKPPMAAKPEKTVKKADPHPEKEDAYTAYLHFSEDPNHQLNEHERFKAAMKTWMNSHHEKITRMMKDWNSAREHVEQLRSNDRKAADKLNMEITERFQKMYQAMEQDGAARKRQLVAIHQQHVQANLNKQKRKTMDEYIKQLKMVDPQPHAITRALEHYIRAEQKDRIHTINHFEHVREVDPEEAERLYADIREHLNVIDKRIEQSMQMLQRVPQLREKITIQIKEFMKTYRSVEESIKDIMSMPLPQPKEPKPEVKPQPEKPKAKKPVEKKKKPAPAKESSKKQPLISDEDEDPAPRVEIIQPSAPRQVKFDPETDEDEHIPYVHIQKDIKHSNHMRDPQSLEQSVQSSSNHKSQIVASSHQGSSFGIAIGSVSVFAIIVITLVVLRKKITRTPTNTGFVEVDQPPPASTSSPEERHVANMQMNGYENPTYKYFETATA
ncbi:amyloid-beta precursor-like protein isoform X2 [Tubulanus polymorphus]|uniref:amyloid-beta precursor-like protein isoform X2 n=1 Tax=Tubulanus polymorphus TaxID=672921 RepID=UPI003DA1FB01